MKLTFVYLMACLAVVAFIFWGMTGVVIDPTYQQSLTARKQAVEQTKQVQAQQWSNTVRGTVPWLAGGLAAVAVAGVGGWAVVEWQRNRTQRHVATEDHTTQRHLITAQKDIVLAYLVQFGEPGAQPMMLNGMRGAYLPSSNEFVPEDVCRAELEQRTALARRQPQTINVQPAPRERRFKVVGELQDWDGR